MGLLRTMLGWIGLQPKAAMGYRSVRVAVRDGAAATMGSGDYHQRFDRFQLQPMSREYFRDNAIYRGLVLRFAGYIVGPGFGLQSKTSKAEWNSEAERVWKRFWRRPEIRSNLSGRAVEKMVAQEVIQMGDVGVALTDRGLLKIIESEQIVGPGSRDDGILKDEAGAPTGYYVAPYSATGLPEASKAQKVQSENFLFLVNPERPTSTRGIPPSQSAFSMLKRINDVCDSEAQAWNLLSRIAIAVTRENGSLLAVDESVEDESSTPANGQVNPRVQVFDGVSIFHGQKGEEIKGIERNIPGQNFTESLTTFLRLLGLPLGLPLEFVMLDWTKSNYSQCRAILEQVSVTLREWQELMVEFFLRPVYEWCIKRAMDAGELPMNDEWEACEFIYPTFPWIDQLKEAQAQGLQVDRGFTTHATVCKQKGQDREEIVNSIVMETLDAIARSKEIEKKTGVKVPYEIFCGRMPAGAPAPAADPAATTGEAPEQAAPKKAPGRKPPVEDEEGESVDRGLVDVLGEVDGPVVANRLAAILRSRRKTA